MNNKMLLSQIISYIILLFISACSVPEIAKIEQKQPEIVVNSEPQKTIGVNKVTISASNLGLEINKSFDLSSSVILDNNDISTAIEWFSSDSSIVTVNSSGKINALRKGNSVIKAVSLLDSSKYAECLVTVIDSEESVPVKIEIENTYGNINIPLKTSVKLNGIVKYINGNFDTNFQWSSSDNNIARINNQGIVTGIKSGKVIITATSNLDISVSAFITLNFYQDGEITPLPGTDPNLTVSSLTIIQPSVTTLKAGESVNLIAVVIMSDNTKNSNVSWSASDSSVASVNSSGLVNCLKAGIVNITATAVNDGSKKSTILLTVLNNDTSGITVRTVSINSVSPNLRVGNNLTLIAMVTMSDNSVNTDLSWSSSDQTVATVNNFGKVSALKEGNVTISATSINDKTKKDSFLLTIKNYFIWYVKEDSTGTNTGGTWVNSYTNLESALNYAQSSDQIWIASGTYKPSEYFTLKSGIKIYGGFAGNENNIESRSALGTVILAGNLKRILFADNVNSISLDGIDIQNGHDTTSDGGGMYIRNSSNISLTNINFIDNFTSGNGGGLLIIDCSGIHLSHVNFSNNFSNEGGSAIGIRDSTSISIIDSEMTGNTSDNGDGTIWNSNSSPVLTNIAIHGNHNKGDSYILDLKGSNPILTNVVGVDND
jgi:uncharacterized protein YjdB